VLRLCFTDSNTWQAIEWVLFALAYTLVALRLGIRMARQQQKHAVVSDVFLVVSALVCLGLIICMWPYNLYRKVSIDDGHR
jgi:cytochrome bd-type quinol oxidase subunit 2